MEVVEVEAAVMEMVVEVVEVMTRNESFGLCHSVG